MFKFRFNADARKEALSAVKKLAVYGSPSAALIGMALFKATNDQTAIVFGAFLNFVVCSFLAVYISGLEERKPEKSSSKAALKAPKDEGGSG